MDHEEFKQLRDLPGKRISEDIVWSQPTDMKPNYVFERVNVENDLGWRVLVNGTFKPGIPSVTYNFQVVGVGPICRVTVNGVFHRGAGRTHKNDLRKESDPRNNLPTAVARTDLEDQSPAEVWRDLCNRAKITHDGTFLDPPTGLVSDEIAP